jgi:catechol 2,3-dioxygenase-like lactoylglutathione lyase family enzyme
MSDVIDHISLGVADLERSCGFYDAVLGTLGFSRLYDTATGSVYGLGKGSDDFSIIRSGAGMPSAGSHVALRARDRRAVDAFHAAALAAGAREDGRARATAAISRELLCCVRYRPGWPPHRSGMPPRPGSVLVKPSPG